MTSGFYTTDHEVGVLPGVGSVSIDFALPACSVLLQVFGHALP